MDPNYDSLFTGDDAVMGRGYTSGADATLDADADVLISHDYEYNPYLDGPFTLPHVIPPLQPPLPLQQVASGNAASCAGRRTVIDMFVNDKTKPLNTYGKLEKQLLFQYFIEMLNTLRQKYTMLVNMTITDTMLNSPEYLVFKKNYETPLSVESTLTLDSLEQSQILYMYMYYMSLVKILHTQLTPDERKMSALLCTESAAGYGGKKKSKKSRYNKKSKKSKMNKRRRSRSKSLSKSRKRK